MRLFTSIYTRTSWHGRRGTIRNRISIDKRPKIIEQKTRIADWESDTVIGKNHQEVLVIPLPNQN
ncbi:hypothetical protein [Nitrosomonas communis]|uniref:hypothetical protein n=1 Tax=Nitrosomonas communis TaxID=44574 RepID=UPI00094286A0|nr:hypothetical protein [Nitrosomonas communis]